MAKVFKTPGVFIEEKSAFPNSAVPVATAVLAFVGYTEKAMDGNKDVTNVPTRIDSFAQFVQVFGGEPAIGYTLKKSPNGSPKPYSISVTRRKKRFYLFHCLKLFFANGGSDCYIVSIGSYGAEITREHFDDENANGLIGLRTLTKEREPTMIVMPDMMSLENRSDVSVLHNAMLEHCGGTMKSRFAILDVYDGYKERSLDPQTDVIDQFRNDLNNAYLQWGAAYYPWVLTNISSLKTMDYTCIDSASQDTLKELLKAELPALSGATPPTEEDSKVISILAEIEKISTVQDQKVHETLLAVSPLYKDILNSILEDLNTLPPAAGMAGIYCMVDHSEGVFKSPANVNVGSVIRPMVHVSDDEQIDLNTPANGKAVNAIRSFPGRGVLIWGARTLDGNNLDFRYISVRRTLIFIEQSIKYAVEPYVFQANTSTTWTDVKALISNFLSNFWRQGGLVGAKPEDAYYVQVGLGITMTANDITEGIMRVIVGIAITHPAEFMICTFEQKMRP
ncbi:MAG: phage tail sheath family protein [Lewinellaceae bacterium]|nr:phage tail sheath family protein [Saprospiraceae bacterium]MCB9344635.1 phage tail sheath family protein [Lewinellaceae bacterium]